MAANIDAGFRGWVDGQDAVQDAVICAYLLSPSTEIRSVTSWLRVTARNVARADLRHKGAEERAWRRWFNIDAQAAEGDATYQWARPESLVVTAVRGLPDRQREVLVLHYWADLEVCAIATRLGISTGTVKSTLHRARANLGTTLNSGKDTTMTAWNLNGNAPEDFEYGRVRDEPSGTAVLCLRSTSPQPRGFGTISQRFDADDYRGRRWRLAGDIRTDTDKWASLWMRVDPHSADPRGGSRPLAFDNMRSRARHGTTSWSRAEIVLGVDTDAAAVSFGFLLAGPGAAHLRNLTFEEVGSDVPTTEHHRPPQRAPDDLDFGGTPQLDSL